MGLSVNSIAQYNDSQCGATDINGCAAFGGPRDACTPIRNFMSLTTLTKIQGLTVETQTRRQWARVLLANSKENDSV